MGKIDGIFEIKLHLNLELIILKIIEFFQKIRKSAPKSAPCSYLVLALARLWARLPSLCPDGRERYVQFIQNFAIDLAVFMITD